MCSVHRVMMKESSWVAGKKGHKNEFQLEGIGGELYGGGEGQLYVRAYVEVLVRVH